MRRSDPSSVGEVIGDLVPLLHIVGEDRLRTLPPALVLQRLEVARLPVVQRAEVGDQEAEGHSTHGEKPLPKGSGKGPVFRGRLDSYAGEVVPCPAC